MAAASYNFSIEQGSDLEVIFQYIDENNTFVNLTNHYILIKWITDSGQIYSFDNITDSNDYKMTTDSRGKIQLNLPARVTNTYSFNSAIYDMDIQEPNEQYPGSGLKRYRFAQGEIRIIKRNIPAVIEDVLSPVTGPLVDACHINCSAFDSVIYAGSGLTIKDNYSSISKISVQDDRVISYVELAINGLNHKSPQDLSIFLAPPSGDKILLFANNKINNYQPGFSFILSDRANPTALINTVTNGGICRISDKANSVRFNNSIPRLLCQNENTFVEASAPLSVGSLNNENLLTSFSGLTGYVPSGGDWSLYIQDNDVGGSGIISNWKLVITYVELES
jgi:subtilisin-like proprotein convertase family protein